MYNPTYVRSRSCFTNRSRKKIDKKSLPTMCLVTYLESAITYNLGLTLFEAQNEFLNSRLKGPISTSVVG